MKSIGVRTGGEVRRSAGRRRIAAGLAVSLLVVACSAGSDAASDEEADDLPDISVEDEDPEPEPEPDPEPEPEEPELEPEPDPEPADAGDAGDDYDGFPIDQPVEDISVIDEAYVNEVLRVLDENYVEVVRAVQRIGVDNIDDVAYAEHILLPLAFTYSQGLEQAAYQRTIAFEERGGLLEDPKSLRSSVTELLTVTEECVSAELTREAEHLYREPFQGLWYVSLTPRGGHGGEAGTMWRFNTESPSGGEVVDACG